MGRRLTLAFGGLLVCALLLAGCDTLNMAHTIWRPPQPGRVDVSVPANMHGGEVATWTATWTGGVGPFTISMHMGGGTTANVAAGTAAVTPFTQVFTMVNPSTTDFATYTYTVVVTDDNNQTGICTATYTVGPTLDQPPVIEAAVYNGQTHQIELIVSDPDETSYLTLSITYPPELVITPYYKSVEPPYPASVTFPVSAADPLTGASGSASISLTDSYGEEATASVDITIDPLPLAPDTLYAIPLQTLVNVGDPVTVVIATGVPANPFQFVNGVGLTIESDADKVVNSFNPGAVGSSGWPEIDGYWTAMAPDAFLLPPDSFIVSTPIAGGRERWDFNLTVIGGSDVATASGALFNYQFTFSSAGTKTFGFQQFEGVSRTYYSDNTATEYFWGDISNAGVSSVTVN